MLVAVSLPRPDYSPSYPVIFPVPVPIAAMPKTAQVDLYKLVTLQGELLKLQQQHDQLLQEVKEANQEWEQT